MIEHQRIFKHFLGFGKCQYFSAFHEFFITVGNSLDAECLGADGIFHEKLLNNICLFWHIPVLYDINSNQVVLQVDSFIWFHIFFQKPFRDGDFIFAQINIVSDLDGIVTTIL